MELDFEKEEARIRWRHLVKVVVESPGVYLVYLLLLTIGLAALAEVAEAIDTGSLDFALFMRRGNIDLFPILEAEGKLLFWTATLTSAVLGTAFAWSGSRGMFYDLPMTCAQSEQWRERQRRLREEDLREQKRKVQQLMEINKRGPRRLHAVRGAEHETRPD